MISPSAPAMSRPPRRIAKTGATPKAPDNLIALIEES